MKYIFLLFLISCTTVKFLQAPKPKEDFIIPAGTFLIINDAPKPIAYKKDSISPWVINDSAAVLKVLLNMVEMQQKYAAQQQIQPKK